jgi:hypothetical protein
MHPSQIPTVVAYICTTMIVHYTRWCFNSRFALTGALRNLQPELQSQNAQKL